VSDDDVAAALQLLLDLDALVEAGAVDVVEVEGKQAFLPNIEVVVDEDAQLVPPDDLPAYQRRDE
jgi:hypothetical protein